MLFPLVMHVAERRQLGVVLMFSFEDRVCCLDCACDPAVLGCVGSTADMRTLEANC
jgi:hypothetical protein